MSGHALPYALPGSLPRQRFARRLFCRIFIPLCDSLFALASTKFCKTLKRAKAGTDIIEKSCSIDKVLRNLEKRLSLFTIVGNGDIHYKR